HLVMMRVHANVNVARIKSMVLSMRNRNEEGQNSEHDDNESDHYQSFHLRFLLSFSAYSAVRRFAVSSSRTPAQTPPDSALQFPTAPPLSKFFCPQARRCRRYKGGPTASLLRPPAGTSPP